MAVGGCVLNGIRNQIIIILFHSMANLRCDVNCQAALLCLDGDYTFRMSGFFTHFLFKGSHKLNVWKSYHGCHPLGKEGRTDNQKRRGKEMTESRNSRLVTQCWAQFHGNSRGFSLTSIFCAHCMTGYTGNRNQTIQSRYPKQGGCVWDPSPGNIF